MFTTLLQKTQLYREEIHAHGVISFFLSHVQKAVIDPCLFFFYSFLFTFQKFSFHKTSLRYMCHWYNYTWTSERAIEIPIFMFVVQSIKPKKLLEIGNVLSHYQPCTHTIVDKYEVAPSVRNCDVVDFRSKQRYDLIISISTLEHVGLHEPIQTKGKSIQAISHLITLLKNDGKLIFSIPIGVNADLDRIVRNKKLPHDVCTFYQRTSWSNHWKECQISQIRKTRYNTPYPHANAIAIITLSKQTAHYFTY